MFVEYDGLLADRDMSDYVCRINQDEANDVEGVVFNNETIACRVRGTKVWTSVWPGFSVTDLGDGILITKDFSSLH